MPAVTTLMLPGLPFKAVAVADREGLHPGAPTDLRDGN